MSKHIKDSLFNLYVKDIDKEFWNKIELEKRLFIRNKKNGNMVDERTGKRNEY